MIRFNLHRFGEVARWSFTNDKSYYLRTLLQMFVVLTLVYLFFTTKVFWLRSGDDGYKSCFAVTILMTLIQVVIGPSMMFYSMKGKRDLQALLLLPASNFEKYLARYATWLAVFVIMVVAYFAADVVQYLVNTLIGNHARFVTSLFAKIPHGESTATETLIANSIIVCIIWMHSFSTLGGVFFRSRKFASVLTVMAFFVISMLQVWLFPNSHSWDIEKGEASEALYIADAVYGVWAVLNFWLSYKLFCRIQNIGKFINI
jgi:hypothetical protein